MRVNAQPARRRPLGMTPLIDVVFILLLFFMVATNFTRLGEVEIGLAGSGAPAVGEMDKVLLAVGPDRQVAVNGGLATLDELAAAIAAAAPSPRTVIVVRAAAGATADDVLHAIDRARDAGLAGIVFAR